MHCPKCQLENPDGIKFCGDCGTKLEITCPHCNCSNPPQFKFCGECGKKLLILPESPPKILLLDEKLEKIQRYGNAKAERRTPGAHFQKSMIGSQNDLIRQTLRMLKRFLMKWLRQAAHNFYLKNELRPNLDDLRVSRLR